MMPLMFAGGLLGEVTMVSSVMLSVRVLWSLWVQRRDFKLWAQEMVNV